MGIYSELGIFKKSMKYYLCAVKKQNLSQKDALKVACKVIERDAGKEAAIGAGLGTALFVPMPVPTITGTLLGYGAGRTVNVTKNTVVGSYIQKAFSSIKKVFCGNNRTKDIIENGTKAIDKVV